MEFRTRKPAHYDIFELIISADGVEVREDILRLKDNLIDESLIENLECVLQEMKDYNQLVKEEMEINNESC